MKAKSNCTESTIFSPTARRITAAQPIRNTSAPYVGAADTWGRVANRFVALCDHSKESDWQKVLTQSLDRCAPTRTNMDAVRLLVGKLEGNPPRHKPFSKWTIPQDPEVNSEYKETVSYALQCWSGAIADGVDPELINIYGNILVSLPLARVHTEWIGVCLIPSVINELEMGAARAWPAKQKRLFGYNLRALSRYWSLHSLLAQLRGKLLPQPLRAVETVMQGSWGLLFHVFRSVGKTLASRQ